MSAHDVSNDVMNADFTKLYLNPSLQKTKAPQKKPSLAWMVCLFLTFVCLIPAPANAAQNWVRVLGRLMQVSVGADGATWGVTRKHDIYNYYKGHWQKIPGKLKQISVANQYQVYGVNQKGQVFRWDAKKKTWLSLTGVLKQVSVGVDGEVWGVNGAGHIYRYVAGKWHGVSGSLKQISVGSRNHIWGVNHSSAIFRWTGRTWQQIAGKLVQVSVGGDGTVWGIGHGYAPFQRIGNGWKRIGGNLVSVSVGSQNYVVGVGHGDAPFSWEKNTFQGVCHESKAGMSMAHTAYTSPAKKQSRLKHGLRYIKHWDGGNNTHAFLATRTVEGLQVCHYAFRGLTSISLGTAAAMGNAKRCTTQKNQTLGTCITEGFHRYNKIRTVVIEDVSQRISKGGCAGGVRLSGHSMGGVLASLLAAELYTINPNIFTKKYMQTFTYGSPRVFKTSDANTWNSRLWVARWVYRGPEIPPGYYSDHVPSYPRSSSGFSHFGTAYIARKKRKKWGVIKLVHKFDYGFSSTSQNYAPTSTTTTDHKPGVYTKIVDKCSGLSGGPIQTTLSIGKVGVIRSTSTSQVKRLSLAPGWTNYAHSYAPATFFKQGNIVVVNGLIRGNSWGHLATLPVGYRPRSRLIFNVNNHQYTTRIDVFPNGQIWWVAGGKVHSWLSLSGIVFSTATGRGISLHNGWRNWGTPFDGARLNKEGNIVTLSGLIRLGKWGHIATLPVGYRPRSRLIFNLNNHQYTTRLDVLPDGRVLWAAGGKAHGWVSLSGIVFSTGGAQALSYANGWRAFGHSFGGAQVTQYGKICVVSGLIRGSQWRKTMVTLPAGCRPTARVIGNVSNHATTARVDTLSNGSIQWEAGGHAHGWVSLSGIVLITGGPAF